KLRWKAAVEDEFRPTYVLHAGDRILVQGSARWQLFSDDGKPLAADELGASDLVLDAPHALFYLADGNGFIAGRRLSDGHETFVTTAFFGNDFRRTLLTRRGRRMLVVSVERETDPHGNHQPSVSTIEVKDLGEPLKVDNNGFLVGSKRLANL